MKNYNVIYKVSIIMVLLLISKIVYARGRRYISASDIIMYVFIVMLILGSIFESIKDYLVKEYKKIEYKKQIKKSNNYKDNQDAKIVNLRHEIINIVDNIELTDDTKTLIISLVNSTEDEEKLLEYRKKCEGLYKKERDKP